MRELELSAFLKSRQLIKQTLLLVFWLPHCNPRVDKTSQKEENTVKKTHFGTIWPAQL